MQIYRKRTEIEEKLSVSFILKTKIYNKNANLADLPLVVHFSAGDYGYSDRTGKYRGALFIHPDCVVWGMPENQEKNPSFVVTLACASDPEGGWGNMDFLASPMRQISWLWIRLQQQRQWEQMI